MPEDRKGLETFDHLIVLMLENRSFDNLFGYLYEHDRPERFIGRGAPEFRGVAGRTDLVNPDLGTPPRQVPVRKAPWETQEDMCQPSPDPGEFYRPHVNRQLYGVDDVPEPASALPVAPMSGFVQDYIRAIREQELFDGVEPSYDHYRRIMDCYPPEALPVLSGLARAFAVSDEWFASVPSQTFCNRSCLQSGQSHGGVNNADYFKWLRNDCPTIFDQLAGAGLESRIYWDEQDPQPLTRLLHEGLRHDRHASRFRHFSTFAEDCRTGNLPAYAFIQPRVMLNHNDMHPPVVPNQRVHSSVLAGELLVAEVYDAVRRGPGWMRSLLVILFDEHGGCHDHWPPPAATPPWAVPPYPLEEGFRFDRFGVRVPAVFISPYVAPGTVIRAPGAIPFDHTSMLRTICRRWGLPGLTDRDRAAPDFAEVFTLPERDARTDTPAMVPRTYIPISAAEAHESLLSGFQKALGHLVAHLTGRPLPAGIHRIGDLLSHLKGP
jgi:phospholipase C